MNLTLTGYSTALYSTWFFLEEYGVLFDAGDGVSAGLLQKSGKVKYVFISHPDRDHLTGLFQFNQLNARNGFPVIHYPKDSGSFPALKEFTSKFDHHVSGTSWIPVVASDSIAISKDLVVDMVRNNHVRADEGVTKSLSYFLSRVKRKLKPEYAHLGGTEIRDLIEKNGNDFVTSEVVENIIGYSGDTPVEDYSRWDGTNVLIHESTFLGGDVDRKINPHGNKHSTLFEVMEMIANVRVNKLVLSHFSPRYAPAQIDAEINRLAKHFNIKIPIYRVLPGQVHRDILNESPVNG